jgi:hypothetical protein
MKLQFRVKQTTKVLIKFVRQISLIKDTVTSQRMSVLGKRGDFSFTIIKLHTASDTQFHGVSVWLHKKAVYNRGKTTFFYIDEVTKTEMSNLLHKYLMYVLNNNFVE